MKPKYNTSKFRNLTSGSTLVTAITLCFASSALAVDNHWTGTSSTDWNTATNWDLGRVPANPNGAPSGDTFDDAVINLTSPVATISSSLSVNPRDIIVGDGTGNSGKLNHVAGTAPAGGWLYVGRGGGTGVYNLADTSGTGGVLTNFATGSGSASGGRLFVGGFSGTGSNGTLNVNTTGSLTVGSELNIGTNNSTGVVNVDNGTVTVNNNWLRVGSNGSTGTLNVSGGSVTKNGGDHMILADNGGTGTVNMSAGAINVNGECWVGQAGGTGILNITGGTLTNNNWAAVARDNNASHGTVNHSGGTWNKTGGGNFIIGDNGQGIYNLSGTGALNANGEFWVGSGGGSHGDLNITGGTLTTDNWVAIGHGGVGAVNMSGGTWNKVGDNQFIIGSSSPGTMVVTGGLVNVQRGFTWVGEGSAATTATLTISNSAEWRTSTMSVGQSTPNAILNLDGGTLKTLRFIGTRNEDDTGDSGGTGTINFNGTQIIASNNNTANFISTTVDNAVITTGGLLVNSNTFKLVAPKALSGTGGVVKSGLGSLTLSGTNSYSGTNTVTAGKLVINGDSTGTGAVTVANGATFGLIQNTNTDSFDASSVTFGTASGATSLELNLIAPSTSAVSALNVTGTLTLNGPVTVNVTGAFSGTGSYPLVHYTGSKAGSGSFVLGTLPPGLVANLNDTGTGLVTLNVTALKHWDGGAVAGPKWDTSTANWYNEFTFGLVTYQDQTSAYFNDLAANPDVSLSVTVTPRSVYFANDSLAYTLSGGGKITGSTGLTKSGFSTLGISTTNDYTGVTRLEGGTTTVGTLTNGGVASALGAASSAPSNLVLAGGILNYTGGAVTIDRGLSVDAIDNSVVSGLTIANNVTLSGQISANLGKFSKAGAGILTLSGTGANVLAVGSDGDAVPPAFSLAEGGLLLNGTGQTDSVIGRTAFGTAAGTTTAEFASNVSFTGGGRTFVALADGSTTTLTVGGTSQLQLNDALLVAQGAGSVGNVVIKDSGKITKTGGYFSLGIGTTSSATMTVRNSGKFISDGDFNIGDVNGSLGTLNTLDSAAVTSSGGMNIGKNDTTGVLNMSGLSTVTSGDTNVGGNGGSHGTLDIKGTSVYTSGGRLQVGPGGLSNGSVVIEESGSMIVNSYVSVGFGGGGSMTLKNNGTFTNSDDFSVNESGDVPATVTLQDTSIMSVARTLYVGRNTGKVGTLTVSGASTLNQTGTGYSLIVGPAGTGTLNIQGTATVNASGTAGVVVTNGGGVGVVNLSGGKLVTTKVSDGGGNSTFNFDGGVLKAGTGAALDFMNGLDGVNVNSGGAFIDTNGQTIAIGQVFGDGGGDVTKQGAGTLLLNGAQGYLGTTTVAAGTLGGTGSLGGPLVVSAVASVAPGASNIGTFTADSAIVGGTYVCEVSGATGDVLATAGELKISAGAKLDFDALAPPTGPATVIATYGSLVGTFTTVQDLPSGYTLDYHYLGNQIAIVSSGASPYDTWAGTFGLNPATDGAPGFDKDSDGQKNLVEFALGGSPISGSNNAKVFSLVVDSSADVDTIAESLLTIAVRIGTPAFTGSPSPTATYDGVTYIIEGSTTLSSFPVAVTPVTLVAPPAPNATPPAGYEYRTFSLSGSNGLGNKGFLRVKVSK